MFGVEEADLKHQLGVSKNSLLVRYYRFAWGRSAPLSFCHMFWGIIFSWVGLIARATFRVGRVVRRKKKPKSPPRPSPTLDKIVDGGSKFAMWVGTHKRFLRLLNRIGVGIAALFLGSLIGLGSFGLGTGVGKLIPVISSLSWDVWKVVLVSVVGTVFVLLAAVIGVSKNVHAKAGYAVSRPVVGGWALFKLCYRAAKTNTCPRIVVVDDERN